MLEDDSDDRYITNEAIETMGFQIDIDFFPQSSDLFNFLNTTKPDLILVDYNSTPENGIQVLKKLKQATALRSIPVVILSDSDHPKYRAECYAEGASTFVKKPTSVDKTDRKIKSFFTYWTEVAAV